MTSCISKDPRTILTFECVETAVQKDKGNDFKLLSFEVRDFTKEGDNYLSFVTSVLSQVENAKTGEKEEISYIAKLNPCKSSQSSDKSTNKMFLHECKILTHVIPLFNSVLLEQGEKPLAIPTCLYASCEEGKEILILNDLRKAGFKMMDGKEEIKITHKELVMKELAMLHAASYVSEHKNDAIPLDKKFSFLEKTPISVDSEMAKSYASLIDSQIECTIKVLQKIKGYTHAIDILKKLRNRSLEIYFRYFEVLPIDNKFRSFCHEDCWKNNLLFRLV